MSDDTKKGADDRHKKFIRFDRFSDKLAVVSLGAIVSGVSFIARTSYKASQEVQRIERNIEQYCDAKVDAAKSDFEKYLAKLEERHDKEVTELKSGLDKANSRIIRILERTSK